MPIAPSSADVGPDTLHGSRDMALDARRACGS